VFVFEPDTTPGHQKSAVNSMIKISCQLNQLSTQREKSALILFRVFNTTITLHPCLTKQNRIISCVGVYTLNSYQNNIILELLNALSLSLAHH
jgi:hypothetical protein